MVLLIEKSVTNDRKSIQKNSKQIKSRTNSLTKMTNILRFTTNQSNVKPLPKVAPNSVKPKSRTITPNTPVNSPSLQPIASPMTPNTLLPKLSANFKGVDKKLVQNILDEIYDRTADIRFDGIAGQEVAKQVSISQLIYWFNFNPEYIAGTQRNGNSAHY